MQYPIQKKPGIAFDTRRSGLPVCPREGLVISKSLSPARLVKHASLFGGTGLSVTYNLAPSIFGDRVPL